MMENATALLTKKIGPAPAYVWYAAGIGIVALILIRRKKAAAAAATPAGRNTLAPNATAGTAPAGGDTLSGLPPQYFPQPIDLNYNPAGQSVPTTPSNPDGTGSTPTAPSPIAPVSQYTDTSKEVAQGSGFNSPAGTAPVVTPAGTFEWISTIPQLQYAQAAGIPRWVQIARGVFVQAKDGALAPGTAQFLKVA